MRQRSVIYAGTLLTGMTGLIYQVVWQKYLTFIVGSETRSVALVVATFLAGLAAGYRYWGRLSERVRDRQKLLRAYGIIELGIGVYAAVFPLYLYLVRLVSYHGPPMLVTDIVVSAMTILVPTFLMGATIPLLVSVVPERAEEVHLCHAKIYGVNTLGACAGAFASSFLLIPRLGLPGTLLLGAAINGVVGAIFILNRLDGAITEKEEIEEIPNRFSVGSIYAYTLITGTITLSFEVLFVRLLNLAIGPGPHNFAIIVGVFIFGLALGSLLITDRMLSVKVLFRALPFLGGYLILLYFTVPYWPYWVNNLRVMLTMLPVNYLVFLALVTGFLALALLPFLIPLGFMLPLVYGLLPKNTEDYGKKCGWLYFYNTLGTAIGAIVLAHLALYAFDLDGVFKINVALLGLLGVWLLAQEKRWTSATAVALVGLLFLAAPGWPRDSYYQALYRLQTVNPWNFTGWFQTPRVVAGEILYFNDGPDATVTVNEYSQDFNPRIPRHRIAPNAITPATSRALIINGKGDGDTVGDYSTITLAGLLPYLYAPDRSDLQAAVVGLGTGLTASTIEAGQDVAHVTVAEISSSLVEASPAFDPDNRDLSRNPNVEIRAIDGFKFFTRLDRRLDLVVSATSPPWVMGVENLFTPEFYGLARDALADDGVFLQWFPLYTMDVTGFRTILKNMRDTFPYLRLYKISSQEMGLVAAKQPLGRPMARRMEEPLLRSMLARMQLERIEQLTLIELYDEQGIGFLVNDGEPFLHTTSRPRLSYSSDRVRFFGEVIRWDDFIDRRLQRFALYSDERQAEFLKLIELFPQGTPCRQPWGECLFAVRFQELREAYLNFTREMGSVNLAARLRGYEALRQTGFWPKDSEFLSSIVDSLNRIPAGAPGTGETVNLLIGHYVKDGMWDEALATLDRLAGAGHVSRQYHTKLTADINGSRQAYAEFARRVRRGG